MKMTKNYSPITDYIDSFERDGVICMRSAFSQNWISIVEAGIERNLREPGPRAKRYGETNGFFEDNCQWKRIPEFTEFINDSDAAMYAGELLRSDKINFFFDNVLVKEPRADALSPWHQDTVYWPIRGKDVISFWLPLDPIYKNTALRLIRGSHAWGKEFIPTSWTNNKEVKFVEEGLIPLPDIEGNPDKFDITYWEMEPGDCLMFKGNVIHGAPANPTSDNRRVLVTRWAGDDVIYDPKDGRGSPPFPDCGLIKGDLLDSETFPAVWRRHS